VAINGKKNTLFYVKMIDNIIHYDNIVALKKHKGSHT